MTNKKPYAVYSIDLVRYLDDLGFKWINVRPNEKIPSQVVFYYRNNPALRDAVKRFLEE